MSELTPAPPPAMPQFPARVVEIIDSYRVAINRGSIHGLKAGTRLVIYGLSREELLDPDTGEPLGRLEIVRGIGSVTHVQERLATVESVRKRTAPRVVRRSPLFMLGPEETISESPETIPFDDVEKGDFARPA